MTNLEKEVLIEVIEELKSDDQLTSYAYNKLLDILYDDMED